MASTILTKLIDYIALLRDSKLYKRQGYLLIELMYAIASHGGLNEHVHLQNLFLKLWGLTNNLNCIPPQAMASLKHYVGMRTTNKDLVAKLN